MQQSKDFLADVKTWNKARLKSIRRRFVNRFRSFDTAALTGALERLGVGRGDTLLVHSSYDEFEGFRGKPSDVIQCLQNLVGTQGLLMMPTMPFTGSAVDYARSNPVFDPLRTPSRMGLLTELFRRSAQVVRSIHPTHPVAIWGAEAATVAADHHLSRTPCGEGTPFAALSKRAGKVVLLGTDIGVLTFFHMIEELMEHELPFSAFTDEEFLLRSRACDGRILETRNRLFEPAVSRRRNLGKLVAPLKAAGVWRAARVGGLRLTVLGAADVIAAVRKLNARGVQCYD